MLRTQRGLHIIAVLGLLVTACGDDGNSGDEASSTGTATTEAGTEAEAGTEVGNEASTTDATTEATTEAETNPTSETTAETGTTDPTTDTGTTDPTTDTGTTGEPSPCAMLETPEECMAMAGCMIVSGQKLKENGPDSPCLLPSEFIGCIEEQACGDALSWFCQGNQTYQTPDTCGPEGFTPCDGPADVVDCP